MAGYFRQPEATSAIRSGDWLDSGDLAYWADGELFICGRSKDIILKAGRNLHPQEIEMAVAEVEGVRKGCVAAFGVADPTQGTEKLVIAAETRERHKAAREELRKRISLRLVEVLGVPADDVTLLAPRSLPKTSSGKLRRAACRQAYERGEGLERPRVAWQWLRLAGKWLPFALGRAAERAGRLAYAAYVYIVAAAILLAGWAALAATPAGRRSRQVAARFARLLLRLSLMRVRVEGQADLPEGPLLLVANHASYIDTPLLMAVLRRPVLLVGKEELLGSPFLKTYIRKGGHLMVRRGETAEGAAAEARIEEALRRGEAVLVFPEGTFTRARGLRPFRLGAFQAAAAVGCPVVPVAIDGTRRFLPELSWTPRRVPVQITVFPSIQPAAKDWREILRLRDAAFEQILAHCGEPRLELVSAALPNPP